LNTITVRTAMMTLFRAIEKTVPPQRDCTALRSSAQPTGWSSVPRLLIYISYPTVYPVFFEVPNQRMKVLVKNMVCDRCKYVIQEVLEELGFTPASVNLGEVDFGNEVLDVEQMERFRNKIEPLGFELINDKKSRLVESIKKNVIAFVGQQETPEKTKISDHLHDRLNRDYTYLSNLFSAVEGVTIEQYFINQKIEKTKEYLVYDELTLTEIAFRLGYSSVAHLSRQFKKVTGLTPSHFKRLRDSKQRKSIDKV